MFSGRRVRQARELRRLTQKELARLIGRSQGTVTHVERGFKEPSSALIAAIAQHTHFPVSFFTTEPSVEFPVEVLLFRARASMTRTDAVAAARYAEIIFEMSMSLAPYVTKIPLRLEKTSKPPSEAAKEARRWLGLPDDEPIQHLVNLLERAGLLVIPIPIEQPDIDAFSAWIQGTPVIALCVGRDAGDRKRWNAAHELGHLTMHFGRTIRGDQHREADQFAGELLLPEKAMRREIVSPVTLTSLAALKPKWGVSIQALIHRAYDLGLVAERQYRYLFEQIAIRGWKRREPENLDIRVEKPRALKKIVEVTQLGRNLPGLAADLHLSVSHVKEILDAYEDISSKDSQAISSKVVSLRRKES
jgi:Zn-dependent peptidase ImmA (M78 family)/transcriptional regulator with XRE-family HTH domain